ncbi:MAG: tail fiber domain-containing protein [Caulobacteraceae bacterium]|nr:tail fiber domain-containing protein [Caulobacteraceae bacterium]
MKGYGGARRPGATINDFCGWLLYDNTGATLYGSVQYSPGNNAVEFGSNQAIPATIYTNNTERARITSGGDLLVGKTSGTAKIDVESSANTIVVSAVATNASYTSNVLDVEASRNTTNSSYNFIAAAVQGVAYRFYVRDSGDVVNTNNSYGGISDIKVKENIVDASPKLADLQNVRIVNFNYKNDQTHKQIGVIAQELEQIFPSMVEEAPDRDTEGNDLGTTTKSVKYSVFVPMLIKAMQEQQALIESLTSRVAQLEGA